MYIGSKGLKDHLVRVPAQNTKTLVLDLIKCTVAHSAQIEEYRSLLKMLTEARAIRRSVPMMSVTTFVDAVVGKARGGVEELLAISGGSGASSRACRKRVDVPCSSFAWSASSFRTRSGVAPSMHSCGRFALTHRWQGREWSHPRCRFRQGWQAPTRPWILGARSVARSPALGGRGSGGGSSVRKGSCEVRGGRV